MSDTKTILLPVKHNCITLIDYEDMYFILKGDFCRHNSGYVEGAYFPLGIKRVLLHRLLMFRWGKLEDLKDLSKLVDHINGCRTDNRQSNLRIVNASQNSYNRRVHSTSSSGYRGVSLFRNGKYTAAIKHQNKRIHLGYFLTPQEAAKAYDIKALELYGDIASLNFPEEYL